MSIHVLLVEDSPLAREKVSSILGELGCEVTTAADGVEGLKVAKQQAESLDLIVLDIHMPKADGITLLRYLRKLPELQSTPIVMLTTQAGKDTVAKALGFGANDFLRKDATIAHITERLGAHVEAARQTVRVDTHVDSKESRDEIVRELLLGSRKPGEEKGPYVLCHVPAVEVHAFSETHGDRLRVLYERLTKGIARINARYPRLQAGYRIETETKEVTRLLKGQEPIPWVLLLGRCQEGISLARMAGFTHAGEERTMHIVCDPIASLDEVDRESVTKFDVHLIEQSEFDGDGLMKLIEKHLLPPAQILPNDVKVRELARHSGSPPRDGQVLTMRYSAIRKDGTVVTNTLETIEPVTVQMGDESIPANLWEALSRMGPGSRALIEVPAGAAEDAVYFQVDLIDVG